MKSVKLIPISILCLFLTSCAKFKDGTSVWQGGLWVLPWLTALASLFFLWKAWKASKSGSWYWGKDERGVDKMIQSKENVPIYKTGWFVFSVCFFFATVAIIWMVNSDK